MLAGDQVARDVFVLISVGQSRSVGMDVCRIPLNEQCSSMSTCEAFTDDLGSKA